MSVEGITALRAISNSIGSGQGVRAGEFRKAPDTEQSSHLDEMQKQKLWKSAKDMEALFHGYLLEDVVKGLSKGDASSGAPMFADMFKQALASQMVEHHGMGMAERIYEDMAKASKALPPSSESAPESRQEVNGNEVSNLYQAKAYQSLT